MATLGDRLKEEREAQGITVRELAERVNKLGAKVHWTTLHNLETRSSGSSRSSREIALALAINLDWLLTGKGPRRAEKSIDKKLQLLPPEDFDDVYDDLSAIIDRRLEKRGIRT